MKDFEENEIENENISILLNEEGEDEDEWMDTPEL